ncbi:hypothetical protein DAPPUDRAFT_249440 [Daphnia pulex]|uniref:Uncharacterized protein n=1 Tax=Daphnia pulex TaxID=6669 RepID=E9GWN7_DAPPU|nr:hypothetical protein DAPPUDRAFT_249440 [Daphnia pulex]|eukprot:EFX76145.1 hypothetical protein DAPPUDRAFT_249440 [Daphnia pulex]
MEAPMIDSFMKQRVGRSSDQRSKPQHPTDAKNAKNYVTWNASALTDGNAQTVAPPTQT